MSALSYLRRMEPTALPWRVARKNSVGPLKLSGWFVENSDGTVVAYVGDSEDSADRAAFLAGWANAAPHVTRLVLSAEKAARKDRGLAEAIAGLRTGLTG